MLRSRIRATSKIMLIALLFAQAAVASAACEMLIRAPAQVFVQHEPMPCHEEPAQNANICLAHCLNADQSADTPQVMVHDWSGAMPLSIPAIDRWSDRFVVRQRVLPYPAAPPARILFQSFQI